ncbi:hypothetical protein EBU71_14690, partial [bacterium]|nr:hypothetical protein [Candidatus Elulimicrobium humile]
MEFGPIKCTYGNFPELKKYKDKIFVIYAGAHPDHTMMKRTNEDLIAEIDQAIKDGYTKIIFHNAAETYQPRVVQKAQLIVELSKHYNDNMFFLQTASHDAQASYDKFFKEWGATRKIHMLPCDHFEFIMHEFANQLYAQVIPEYKVKLKEKKFVCFNKVDRIHRVQLFAKVLNTPGLLEQSFYSFEGTHPVWYTIYPEDRWGKDIADTLQRNKHIFPLRLNINENRHNPIDLLPEDLYYHDESYFSVVTETIYYKEGEKDMSEQPEDEEAGDEEEEAGDEEEGGEENVDDLDNEDPMKDIDSMDSEGDEPEDEMGMDDMSSDEMGMDDMPSDDDVMDMTGASDEEVLKI